MSSTSSNSSAQLSAQQLLQQFHLFRSQFQEQQQQQQVLQSKITQLETAHSLQHGEYLRTLEREIEQYYFQIQTSQHDDIVQHNLDLLNLISLRIHNVDYRGVALRDLFQLQRGLVPASISNISVQSYIDWIKKRLNTTKNNPPFQSYYRTLLKHIHIHHPVMDAIKLGELSLLPQYFPASLSLWPGVPTPNEYHRLLISIVYDLTFHEVSILPLLTHFGLPIAFPPQVETALSTPSAHSTSSITIVDHEVEKPSKTQSTRPGEKKELLISIPESTSTDVKPSTSPSHHQQYLQYAKDEAIGAHNQVLSYLGHSTHLSSLLYAPLWFGVLSRDAFRSEVMHKTPVDGDSFIASKWFSTLCRGGFVFDQIVRIANNYSSEGLYPVHHAYQIFLPRFFSSSDLTLTDTSTFVLFGNHGFPKIYSFLLFIANHLANTHSLIHKYQIVTSTSSHPTTPLSTRNVNTHPPTPAATASSTPSAPTSLDSSSNLKPPTIDMIAYPFIKDLYFATIKGQLDTASLSVFLRSDFFNTLQPSERNNASFSRNFGIFHFKLGVTPTWLAKPFLGTVSGFKPGSAFESLCTLHSVEHLQRYFDRTCDACCEKPTFTVFKQRQQAIEDEINKKKELSTPTKTVVKKATPLGASQSTPNKQ